MTTSSAGNPEDVAVRVADALEQLGVRYLIGGSVASSLLGEPRATNDVDFLVELREPQIAPLVEKLGTDFSADEEALRDAARRGRSWNVFFLPLVTKVDLFFKGGDPFDDSQLARRRTIALPDGGRIYVATAEDVILKKLAWYRSGCEVANSQWRDVLGVLAVAGARLDRSYLDAWANTLGIADLLQRALVDTDSGRS